MITGNKETYKYMKCFTVDLMLYALFSRGYSVLFIAKRLTYCALCYIYYKTHPVIFTSKITARTRVAVKMCYS